MANNIKQYDLLISCPGDAAEAVDIIKEVVYGFNQQFSDALGIVIRCRYWKDSAYAESGGKPQDLLNKQIVNSSDLAVAVFKNRFGSPTDKYGSGTEEEIEKMLSAGKQVFMFFDESPVKMTEVDINEYNKVQDFKAKYEKDKGIYVPFANYDEFRNVFRAHITMFFMKLYDDKEDGERPNLIIKSYRDGKLLENAQLSLFDMNGVASFDKLRQQIIEQIGKIKEIHLDKSSHSQSLELFDTKVIIDDDSRNYITEMAKILDITLGDDFFDVGNLTKSALTSSLPFGEHDYKGTHSEKTKYNAIKKLKRMLNIACSHYQLDDIYKDLYGVILVLCNTGTIFDEDIDVEITIPKDRYISVDELSVPTEEIQLVDDLCFEDIFIIKTTKDFISYNDSKRLMSGFNSSRITMADPFYGKSCEEEYKETLRDIFEYKVFPDDENVIIRVHFDYIKQHQNVAFPTWLFIKNTGEEISAKYRIISKKNRDIVEWQICVSPPKCDIES